MSSTPRKISREMDVNIRMNCGLWFILNRAENDSMTPTIEAKANWTAIYIGI